MTNNIRKGFVSLSLAIAMLLVMMPTANAGLVVSECKTETVTVIQARSSIPVESDFTLCVRQTLISDGDGDTRSPFYADAVFEGPSTNVGVQCAPEGKTPSVGGGVNYASTAGLTRHKEHNLVCVGTVIFSLKSETITIRLDWEERDYRHIGEIL